MPSYRLRSVFRPLHLTGYSRCPSLGACNTRDFATHKRPQARKASGPELGPRQRIFFSSTSKGLAREQNHYETLDMPVTATAAEIKKQFYALSLRHHPDRNRDDPSAGERFARISAAYHILGNATKRATYDRDNGIHHIQSRAQGQHPMGSHSSHSANLHHKGDTYAGSRPASGLSKRRSAFHGPPPSFYTQGGYGATGRMGGQGSYSAGGEGQKKGQDGDAEDPYGFIDRNMLGHFNARGHFRTQQAEDERRRERRRRTVKEAVREQEASGNGGELPILRFVVSIGILVLASAIGLIKVPAIPTTDKTETAGKRNI
ncbi:hypothetical protein N7495_000532 [Penicillium taxi]|uniref:uncharacterized protein n=1 Tax=Penicillium taxi TaxID=168475 RepID=UPI002544E635|nr:uncharacterized protein N7495_000532 [Penicillium taxi]KAJ5907850.1 hypothetical protein N7495_000532 [Penicillium taxi]